MLADTLIWAILGAPALSTCMPPPLETQVSRAAIVLDGRVERVVYLQRDGTPEGTPRRDGSLCGPKLVTFRITRLLKGEAGATLTVFAEDGCVGLGGYYREGEEYLQFVYTAKRTLADTETSRSVPFPDIAPPSVSMFVHACGGRRRIRDGNSDRASTIVIEGYVAEIKRLLTAGPRRSR